MKRARTTTPKTAAARRNPRRIKPRPLGQSLSRLKSTVAICSALMAGAGFADAAAVYWDINGATVGASGTGSAAGTWDGANVFFNTDSTGAGGGALAAWASGDTAIFSAGGNATQAFTITVSGTQQIGGLTFEEGLVTLTGGTLQMTAASIFDVASALTATVDSVVDGAFDLTKTGAGRLVLGANNTYSGKTILNAGTLSISADLNLGVDPGTPVADSLTFGGNSTLQITSSFTLDSDRGITINAGLTGTMQVDSPNTLTYGGIVAGIAGTTFKKTGAGTLDLQGVSGLAGALNIDGGVLKLSGAGTLASTSGVTLGNRGTFTLDNSGTNSGNRTAGAFASSGGTINFLANAAATTETLGALTLNAGALTITTTAGAGGSILTIPSLTRTVPGGTLYLNGAVGAAPNQVVLTASPALVNSVLRYAVVTGGGLTSFANYATSAGANQSVRPLALASHQQGAETTWTAATVNARPIADQTMTANRTLYTLTLDSGIDLLAPTADRSLTLSGGVLQTGGVSVVAASGTLDNILAFGTNEALFHILGSLQLDRGNTSTLTGTAGLTKSGAGTLILNGVSTLTIGVTGSAININEGILELRGITSLLPAASAATVNLNGATLRLSNDTSSIYNAPLAVNADSTIQVDRVTPAATTNTHTVGILSIGGGRVLSVNSNDITADTAYGLTTGALTLTSGGATFNVANNGTATGTMTVGLISGAFPITKTGAGDFVTNSTTTGYTAPVDIQAGRLGWSGATATVTEAQVFSGAGGIIKSGAGTVNLTGANRFTGGLTATAGVLQFSTVSDNGGSASNLGQGTDGITLSAGTLSFIGSTNQSTNRAINITGAGTLAANGVSGATITFAGPLTSTPIVTGTAATFGGTGAGFVTGGLTMGAGGLADATMTGGTWTFQTGTVTVADDFTLSGAATVLNLNSTGVLSFQAASADATLAITAGATVNLGVDNAVDTTAGIFDRLFVAQAGAAGTSTLNMGIYDQTTDRFDVGAFATGLIGNVTGTGDLTVNTTLNLFTGQIDANLISGLAVNKQGLGTLTLTGNNNLTSATASIVTAGNLVLEYGSTTTNKFTPTTTGLDMRGGTLTINGNGSSAVTQTVASLTLATGGASRIDLNSVGQSVTLNLGLITRGTLANDGTMRFELPAAGAITTTSVNNNATSMGILGGWATVDNGAGVFFARNNGSGPPGNIVAANTTLQDAIGSWVAGDNVSDDTLGFSGTLADCLSINSLRFNANAASAVTLPVGGGLRIATGGILMTSAAASGAHTISGGALVSGIGELIFTQDSSQGLDVSSIITAATGVTKAGTGTLTLSGANNYTGITDIQAGTLVASGGNAIGDTSPVTLAAVQASSLQITANETIGNLAGGRIDAGIVVGNVDIGSNTLTINETLNTTFSGFFTGSGTVLKSGASNLTYQTGNGAAFTGTLRVDQGSVLATGNVSHFTALSAIVLNGPTSSLRIDNDAAAASNAKVIDSATVTLSSTAGGNGFLYRRTAGTTNGTETVGPLTLDAGHNVISAFSSNAAAAQLTFGSLAAVNNHATALVRGTSLGLTAGERGNIIFTTAPAGGLAAVGGGGAALSTTISIFPYLIGHTTDTGLGNSFVRNALTAALGGLVPLTTAEYITNAAGYNALTGATTNNVRFDTNPGAALTGTPTSINSLVLDGASAITLTGPAASLEITSGAILSAQAAANVINTFTGLTTGGGTRDYTIYVTDPAGSLTISSALTSGAPLVKSGAGSLILGGVNTALTDAYLNQGIVEIGDLDAIGGNTGGLNFAGGTLRLGSAFDVGTDDVSGRTITFLTGGGTLDTNGKNPTFAGDVGSGSGTFTKIGTGNLTLNSGSTAHTGNTILSAGEITLGAIDAIGSGNVTIAAGALLTMNGQSATVGSVTTADSATNPIAGLGTLTASGNMLLNRGTVLATIAGTTNLIKATTAQTVTLSSLVNSYTGYTWIQDGTLSIAAIQNAGVNSPIGAPIGENGTIRLGGPVAQVGILAIGGAAMSTDRSFWLMGTTGGGTIDKDGTGALTLNGNITGIGIGTKTLTLQGTAGTLMLPNTLNGEICELNSVFNVTKAEAGVWLLPNANTYTGTTTISAGTLMIGNNGSLGTGSISFTGTTGTLDNSGGSRTLANNVSLGGTGTLQGTGDFNFTGSFSQTGGNRTLNINNVGTTTFGDLATDTFVLAELDQARTLTLAIAATSPTIINATIQDGAGTGADGLIKTGPGSLTINAANTYTGGTTLSNGTLTLGDDAALGTGDLTATAASTVQGSAARSLANNLVLDSATAFSLTLGGSSTLAFNNNIGQSGNNHSIAITNSALTTFGSSSADSLTLAETGAFARTLTLDVGAGGLAINSTIVDGGGSLADSLIKTGVGTMTLSAANTYTGTTALQNGATIAVGGAANRLPTTTALTLGSGANSATLQLGDATNGASDQTLASLATSGSGTTNAIVGGNATFSTLTVNQSGNTTYAGNIGGTGTNENNLNVVKQGAGQIIVSGTGSGAWTGTTTVNGGQLLIDSTSAFAAASTSLTVDTGAEFSLRGTGLVANQVYGFGAGAGNKITLGTTAGNAVLGFRIDGAFNTQLQLVTGQTMTVTTGSTFQTAIYVDDAPTAASYILIDGADDLSLHAGGGTFDPNPVVFNGGSFTYALTNDNGGNTYDRWILTPTAVAAAADTWWKGDLGGIATGVWSAALVGPDTNWDDSMAGGVDAQVPPDSGSIVHFSANSAGNFATTLGANLTIQELRIENGTADISVGGANTLTIGNTSDPAGITMLSSALTNLSFSANVALAQAQSFNIADGGDFLTFTGALSGTGPLGINDNGSSTGTVILGGASGLATYSGATNLVTGRVILQGGASNRLPTTTALTMGNATLGATLQLGNVTGASNTTIGTLNTGAATTNSIVGGGATASVLTVVQGSAGTFNGVIGGGGTNENQVGITKQGSATLVLSGANTYTGATTINNGILQLGAAGSITQSSGLAISANAGVTAALDANGRPVTLTGAITLDGADATAQANILDTATGGLLTLGGNVTYSGTNNPLGSTIGVNIDAGATARTILANDSSNATTELTIGALTNTLVAAASLTFDGTGAIVLNSAGSVTGATFDFLKNGTGTLTVNAATTATDDWLINVGVVNATVSNALNATDNITIDGTGVQDSAILNISGTAGGAGIHQGDDFFIRNGGRVNVLVNNGISLGTDNLLIGDLASVGAAAAGRLNLAADIAISNGIQLGATGGHIGNITGTGLINSTPGTFSLRGGSIDPGITLAGTAGIAKVGDGTVTFSGARTASGATAIQEGNLILDYTTNNASKIGGVLTLGLSNANVTAPTALTLNANSAGTTQSVTSTTISNSGDVLVDINDAGAATTLALGAITRTVVGGTVSFDYSSANAIATTTTPATGALGWATVTTGGTTRIGAIAGGNIVQATTTTENNVAAWGRLQNIINTAGYTGTLDPACNTIASLTFDAAAASTVTMGSGSTLIITSGGILVNSGVGSNASIITGGSILGSATAPLGELMIHQNNTAGSLTINSDIVSSSGITKSGLGRLVLGGTNTFLTGSRLTLNEGTVELSGGTAIGDSTIVIMRSGTTLDLNNSNETIGNLGVDTTNLSAGTIDLGSGTLTINQAAASTFTGAFVGSGTVLKSGTGTLTLTGASTMTGTLRIDQGQILLSGNVSNLNAITAIILNGPTSSLQNNQDQTSANNRITNTATVLLNNTAGGTGFALSKSASTGNATEVVGALTLGAGHNVITATTAVADVVGQITFASLAARNNRATSLVRGLALGDSTVLTGRGQIVLTAAPTAPNLAVGGGGAAASQNISIFPYLVGDATAAGLGNSFVMNTGTTNGLRPLTAAEYINDSAAPTTGTNNIRYTATNSITTPATVNSLVLDSATAIALTGSASSMEVTSGAILAAGAGNHSVGTISGLTTGGGRDYTVYVTAATSTLSMNSPLTSAVPLVKSGAGTLSLTNTGNLFTDVYLNQGTLLFDDLDKVNNTTGVLRFFGGGVHLAAGFTDDLSTKTWDINTGGGSIDVSLVTAGATFANGIDDTTVSASDTLTILSRTMGATGVIGQLTINGASTYTGTTVFNHTLLNSGVINSVVLNGTTNAAINGNLIIGNTGTIPNNDFDVALALGADEQIVNTASLTFNSTAGEEAYFKLLGRTETVAGISAAARGVIENYESAVDQVAGNGTLIVNSSADFSYTGFMRNSASGTGGTLAFTKQGTGTQTLTGANIIYTGPTTISGGTLQLTDATAFSATSAITNNANLTINRTTATQTFGNVISGTGKVTKLGAGTVTLSGATSSYSGLTDIQQGILSFSASANLGDASVTNDIRIANGATLQSTGASVDLTANRSIFLSGVSANIEVTASNVLRIPGVVSGPDCPELIKLGTGTAILSGANSYVGVTRITAGTLQIGDAGTTGNLGTGDVIDNGTLQFNRTNAMTVANQISGTGAVQQIGAGTTTLTGTNTYTGKTTISDGVLSISSDANLGTAPGSPVADQLTLSGDGVLKTTANVTVPTNRGITVAAAATAAINNSNGTNFTINSDVALNTGSTLASTGDMGAQTVVNGDISGAGNLTVSAVTAAGHTLTLDPNTTNSFSGATAINADATLIAQGPGALGSTSEVTVNTGGTLLLTSTGDRINNSAPFTLSSSTNVPADAPRLNTTGLSETVGALTLSGSSTTDIAIIDLAGLNVNNALTFAASNANTWTGQLQIWNFSGITYNEQVVNGFYMASELDQIFFGTSNSTLTNSQLSSITFFSDSGASSVGTAVFGLGANGQIVPVPEPTGALVGLAMFGLAGLRERRRANARRRDERAASRQ